MKGFLDLSPSFDYQVDPKLSVAAYCEFDILNVNLKLDRQKKAINVWYYMMLNDGTKYLNLTLITIEMYYIDLSLICHAGQIFSMFVLN